ncbi:MAG: hypothetical protein NZM18_07820 [Thermoflexales bacterium]|nr:hypothetical protein [Thermoflexales bacterium]MDW8351943.1 hypothetical protein [Anaerolineae bacterium]
MAFEAEAREERAYYDSLSLADLHALIHERRFGRTGMLWQSLRERATLLTSGWVLLELLERRSVNREARAQAASVLLDLADCHDWSPEALADDSDPEFEGRLRELRRVINARLRAASA